MNKLIMKKREDDVGYIGIHRNKIASSICLLFFSLTMLSTGSNAQSRSSKSIRVNPVTITESKSSSAQWLELKGSEPTRSVISSHRMSQSVGGGDRIVIVEAGESLQSIVKKHTGLADHWLVVAEKNQLKPPYRLELGSILLVPESLLMEPSNEQHDSKSHNLDTPQSTGQGSSATAANGNSAPSVVSQNGIGTQDGIGTLEESSASLASVEAVSAKAKVTDKDVNMFLGQVSVFGKVAVEWVDVENESVLSAEVLPTGELLVIAQEQGSSSLRLWHQSGERSEFYIRVTESGPELMDTMINTLASRHGVSHEESNEAHYQETRLSDLNLLE